MKPIRLGLHLGFWCLETRSLTRGPSFIQALPLPRACPALSGRAVPTANPSLSNQRPSGVMQGHVTAGGNFGLKMGVRGSFIQPPQALGFKAGRSECKDTSVSGACEAFRASCEAVLGSWAEHTKILHQQEWSQLGFI